MRRRVISLIASLLVLAVPSFAADPVLSIQGLDQRVDFWKKIFTQYGENDIVIHDFFHVNLIYNTATDAEVKAKTNAVRNTLRELRAGLTTPESWSPAARDVAASIEAQGLPMTASTLDYLAANIHTQRGIKERFRSGVIRSGKYIAEYRQIFQTAGLPTDLALLPLVESSFENVRSKAGAVGIWQFTRSTGRSYLKIGSKVDERLDPVKAAKAAAALLRDNYKNLKVWPLAVTAYNHGGPGMLRAQKQHGSDLIDIIRDYQGPVFGFASMNFYAEFLAAVDVYETYPRYFGELVLDTPTPARPASTPMLVAAKTAATQAKATSATDKYKVQKGDTLSNLAQRFGTSIRSLMELNDLNHSAIYAGQILLVK